MIIQIYYIKIDNIIYKNAISIFVIPRIMIFDVVFVICVCVVDILFLGWVYYTCDIRPNNELPSENINNPLTTHLQRAEI